MGCTSGYVEQWSGFITEEMQAFTDVTAVNEEEG
jgi:hypothetical protein